jgi:hypothetical protein
MKTLLCTWIILIFPRTPILYLLPKIHIPNNYGRLIVYFHHSVTERITAFEDFHLQPIVQSSLPYIKDTNHFLTILSSFSTLLHFNILLTTIDVTSLYEYINILHTNGLFILENDISSHLTPSETVPSIPHPLHINFSFNSARIPSG